VKLLLAEDVRHLGKAGDIVDVRDGYARNYLVPQGLALIPTQGNIERVEEMKKKRVADVVARKARLAEAAAILEGTSITIKAQANEQGHLFGSVTHKDIAAALQALGHKIDADQVLLAEPIRMLDRFHIPVRLEEGFEANIDLWVVPEEA
jgi:large subunit ribosomal protein L9